MGTIQRAIKRGDVRTFDESYSKGFKNAWASEVDADFNQLYDAWNFGTINVAAGSVGTGAIADGAVTSAKLADDSVDSHHIIDGAVDEAELDPAIAARLTPPYSIAEQFKIITVDPTGKMVWVDAPPAQLVPGQVETQYIADAPNGVTDAKITSVSWSKITGAPTSFPPGGTAGGSLTGNYPNPGIKADAVTSVEIAAGAVGNAELASNAVTNVKVVDVAWGKITGVPPSFTPTGAAGGDLAGSYPNPSIGSLKVVNANLGAGCVTDAKVTDVAWAKVTGKPTSFPPTGGAGGSLTGTYPSPTIATAAINAGMIAPGQTIRTGSQPGVGQFTTPNVNTWYTFASCTVTLAGANEPVFLNCCVPFTYFGNGKVWIRVVRPNNAYNVCQQMYSLPNTGMTGGFSVVDWNAPAGSVVYNFDIQVSQGAATTDATAINNGNVGAWVMS